MQKKINKKKNPQKKANPKSKIRFLIIFASAFVSLVLALGITLGAIAIARENNNVASFRETGMDIGVATYFASCFKSDYKSALSYVVSGVEDSPGFWNSVSQTGDKYIDILSAGAKEYIKKIIVMNYLYDRYAKLSSVDKDIIESALAGTLKTHGGSVEAFNEIASKYGFDYDDYKKAVEMLYKAASLEALICGTNGSKLKASNDADVLSSRNSLLAEYSHVKLLYISTELTFVYDENGNRVSEGGAYKTESLNPSERTERLGEIESIRAAIAAIGSDGTQMGPDMFDYYMNSELYSGMLETRDHGYYFREGSSYTKAFDQQDVVSKSLSMSVGEFAEVTMDGGVCFIYKMPTSVSDLSVTALEAFFVDFYEALSDKFIEDQVAVFTPEVKIKEELDEIDLVLLPYNYEINPSFVG